MQGLKPYILSATCLVATSTMSLAQDWHPDRAYISIGSYHAGVDANAFGLARWNEINPGLVLAWEDRFLGLNYAAGGFVNSFGDLSPYLGISRFWPVGDDLAMGLFAAVTHYGDNSKFFPTRIGSTGLVVVGGLQLNYRNIFVQLQPAQRTDGGLGAVIAAGVTFSLR